MLQHENSYLWHSSPQYWFTKPLNQVQLLKHETTGTTCTHKHLWLIHVSSSSPMASARDVCLSITCYIRCKDPNDHCHFVHKFLTSCKVLGKKAKSAFEPSGSPWSGWSLSQFQQHEATTEEYFYSPLDGMLVHCRDTPKHWIHQ